MLNRFLPNVPSIVALTAHETRLLDMLWERTDCRHFRRLLLSVYLTKSN